MAIAASILLALAGTAVAAQFTADQFDGDDGPNRLTGTPAPDTINGRGGNDQLRGLASGDRLLGKRGNDLLVGGAGPDRLFGGAGADQLKGGPANDILDGGDGSDRIVGGGGNDLVFARAGNDRINVRDTKQDTVSCGSGTDTVKADLKDRVNSDCETVQRPQPPRPVPAPSPAPPARSQPGYSDVYNCDDFPLADGTTAQDYLNLYPSDPSGLDGNDNGIACESD
ncbi:MAG: calcium-binding protein [Thermoleophilia bacterium]